MEKYNCYLFNYLASSLTYLLYEKKKKDKREAVGRRIRD